MIKLKSLKIFRWKWILYNRTTIVIYYVAGDNAFVGLHLAGGGGGIV